MTDKIKVTFFCATHDTQSKESETLEVDADMTDDELMEMAKDYFYEKKEPEWWFEKEE